MIREFGIKCKDFHVMKAFKEACEEMGWEYIEDFTEFSREKCRTYGEMYFTTCGFGKISNAFSITNLSASVSAVFTLPLQWEEALEHAKQLLEEDKKVMVQLNKNYTAEVDLKSKTAKVGCQTFTYEKIKELYLTFEQPTKKKILVGR
jgi:hypothetical protein